MCLVPGSHGLAVWYGNGLMANGYLWSDYENLSRAFNPIICLPFDKY